MANSLAQGQAPNPTIQSALQIILTVADQACLASTVADQFINLGEKSTLILNSNNSCSLSNNFSGGTFPFSLYVPEGSFTTSPLSFGISAANLQADMNAIAGIQSTVTSMGSSRQSRAIAIEFNIEIGNSKNDTKLQSDNRH